MATLSFSPTGSISSHTLSSQSVQPPSSSDANSAAAQALVTALSASPHDFLQPTSNLHNATLALAKHLLDPLASGVSEVQVKRQQEARKKRKRGEGDAESGPVLQLKKVHLEGFGVEQVWEQSKRVLDAARAEVERDLPEVLAETDGFSGQNDVKMVGFGKDGLEVSGSDDDEEGESEVGEEGVDWDYEGDDVSEEADEDAEEELEEGFHTEEEDEGSDIDDIDMDRDDYDDNDASQDDEPAAEYVPDPNGLNDGFFSIDDFNRQAEFLEQQDARGDDEDAASDEEEVNWAEDPLNSNSLVARGLQKEGAEDTESEDEEDGPTFGNMDLNAPEGASDDDMDDVSIAEGEMDGMGDMGNANNIMYADFFAPPAKKASKNKKGRPHPHNFPSADQKATSAPNDEDVEKTMAAVHRDLFDESDDDQDASDLSEVDADDPKARKSTHERRQAKLAEEIRRLESQNVAKREWTLSGEARAADRPQNSLLEEDLDFERAGKPVPVITAEVSEDIESLIKRRIINREFDEVIKRRPEDLATGPTRRGRFELDDTKAQKGLAEEYEEDHLRKTDPNYVDVKDEKLKKEHREIAALWRDVSAKLDALSSWHYKPKPADANLEIRTDAAAITMEDARPTAGGDIGGSNMLAPQELYAPGEERTKGEVVTKGGMPIAKEELSREDKKSRRRRAKERLQKTGGPEKQESKQTKERKEVVSNLKKGGVKVINKKGEVTDVEGKAVKNGRAQGGAGNFKL
ncbi:putative u3 small nucleolar ribonucleoprotein mpp10 [Diplodia seriata]|uniref:U3 small nucleolar ribonucleoprotein protein MPP10 n=1 Tax=Diplodia seriata TaxID=420778 RepID=A0A0G2EKU7_9PEZI|nr:putative u3 small nucleolar ribonucleoprotein mpp10 [Diplodia seriata]